MKHGFYMVQWKEDSEPMKLRLSKNSGWFKPDGSKYSSAMVKLPPPYKVTPVSD